jgi:hypothetical protein
MVPFILILGADVRTQVRRTLHILDFIPNTAPQCVMNKAKSITPSNEGLFFSFHLDKMLIMTGKRPSILSATASLRIFNSRSRDRLRKWIQYLYSPRVSTHVRCNCNIHHHHTEFQLWPIHASLRRSRIVDGPHTNNLTRPRSTCTQIPV